MLVIKKDFPSYVLSKDVEIKLKVASGDTVEFETFDCFENQITSNDDTFDSLDWERINPVSGPLYVVGAEAGDTLAVDILSIDVEDKIVMLTGPGLGVMGDELEKNAVKVVPIKNDKVIFNGFQIPLNKMIGVIGTAPKEGAIPSGVPDSHGGNMDCTEICEGATLYLPVNHTGGLLFMGDLHAVMGDGEVAVCGGEVAGKVKVRVRVLKGINLPLPAVVNDDTVIAIASEDTLDDAAVRATKNMHQTLSKSLGMTAPDTAMLLSLVGNLKVCQIVDPKMTMRMEVSREYFKGANPFEK